MKFFLFISYVFVHHIYSFVVSIDSYKDSHDTIQKTVNDLLKKYNNQEIMVLFDVDLTLTKSIVKDSRGNNVLDSLTVGLLPSKKLIAKMLFLHPSLIGNINKIKNVIGVLWEQSKRSLIDTSVLDVFSFLKGKNIAVLGLADSPSANLGPINNFPEFRVKELLDLGISFSSLYPDQIFSIKNVSKIKKIMFPGLPLIHRGMICTNQNNKGLVLGYFLDQVKKQNSAQVIKVVIFFDDNQKNIDKVKEACEKRNIIFFGFNVGIKNKFLLQTDKQIQERIESLL